MIEICPNCKSEVKSNGLIRINGQIYCSNCATKCSSCSKYFPRNRLTIWNNMFWCDECLEKEAERIDEQFWEGQWKGKM